MRWRKIASAKAASEPLGTPITGPANAGVKNVDLPSGGFPQRVTAFMGVAVPFKKAQAGRL